MSFFKAWLCHVVPCMQLLRFFLTLLKKKPRKLTAIGWSHNMTAYHTEIWFVGSNYHRALLSIPSTSKHTHTNTHKHSLSALQVESRQSAEVRFHGLCTCATPVCGGGGGGRGVWSDSRLWRQHLLNYCRSGPTTWRLKLFFSYLGSSIHDWTLYISVASETARTVHTPSRLQSEVLSVLEASIHYQTQSYDYVYV